MENDKNKKTPVKHTPIFSESDLEKVFTKHDEIEDALSKGSAEEQIAEMEKIFGEEEKK